MIQREFNRKTILQGDLSIFTIVETALVAKTLYHGLGFIPTEAFISQGHGKITFDFTSATDKTINYSTTGAVTARVLLGRLG